MTAPAPTHATQPADTEQQKDGLDLSPTKTIASALAAISTAVAASYLGTMGTWVGAGVGSVVATVSTAVYHHSLRRTSAKLKTVVPLSAGALRRRPQPTNPPPTDPPASDPHAAGGRGTDAPAGDPEPWDGVGRWLRAVRWGRLAAVAGVVFALSMGAIVSYELLADKPLSAQLRGTNVKGTSLTPKGRSQQPPMAPEPSRPAGDIGPSAQVPTSEPSRPAQSAEPAPSTPGSPAAGAPQSAK